MIVTKVSTIHKKSYYEIDSYDLHGYDLGELGFFSKLDMKEGGDEEWKEEGERFYSIKESSCLCHEVSQICCNQEMITRKG